MDRPAVLRTVAVSLNRGGRVSRAARVFLQLIEEGYEKNGAALEAQQKAAESELLGATQQRLTHPLTGTTLIRNARVFDSEKATLGPASDILIQDSRIVAIAGVERIAGRG